MIQNGNAQIEKTAGRLSIVVPSKKIWPLLIFVTVFLGGWAFGLYNVIAHFLLGSGGSGVAGFIIFWLMGWMVGGLAVIGLVLWGYFGKESFVVTRDEVVFSRKVFGVGPLKKLIRAEVKNIRVDQLPSVFAGGINGSAAFFGLGVGRIKFDYGFKTYSFGLACDEAEAVYLVGLIRDSLGEGNGK